MEQTQARNWPRRALAALAFALFAAVLVLALEAIHRQSGAASFAWVQQRPKEFGLNLLIAGASALLVLALTGRGYLALGIVGAVVALLGLVNVYKQLYIRQPLFPWDIFLHRHATDLLPHVWRGVGTLNTTVLLGSAALLLGLRKLAPIPLLDWKGRAGVLALSAGILFAVSFVPPRAKKNVGRDEVCDIYWDQIENYRRNGVLLAFTMNLGAVNVQAPKGYRRAEVARILPAANDGPAPAAGKPNVIVVMSESFFDPTTFPGLTFSADPMPNLRKLRQEHAGGWLYSPSYGGFTANAEFELLTGNSMRFLPVGSIPYQQYVKRDLPSLASIYAAQGYRTVALHTYQRWFWEREQVYRHFGFQKFISSEDMPGAPIDGLYISDSAITDGIVHEVERGGAPLFLFAITMEGHGPYRPGRYRENRIRVDGPLSPDAKEMFEGYVEGLSHSDRELQRLIDYFAARPEPTIVVFFGDHLPLLAPVYEQTGLVKAGKEWRLKELEVMHRTPLLIWQNQPSEPRDLGLVSPSLLGPYLLELSGAPLTPYMRFLSQVRRQMPVLMRGLASDAQGRLHEEPPAELKALEEQWWMLQYDLMFGEGHQLAPGMGG